MTGCLDRLGSPWSANAFGVLPAVRARKLHELEERLAYEVLTLRFTTLSRCSEAVEKGSRAKVTNSPRALLQANHESPSPYSPSPIISSLSESTTEKLSTETETWTDKPQETHKESRK
ncbi:hypothetical protein AVEN_244989-1 [Araneus ventricosus]|uniref:Uncharacterized protein n=1 Tax=Araneus ventricosus TaxID=182803 RepID=A0A4Y2F6W6_ARAVE|nr:hypothetical protein AVEN_244989-1 [Araneus ventricosus]